MGKLKKINIIQYSCLVITAKYYRFIRRVHKIAKRDY